MSNKRKQEFTDEGSNIRFQPERFDSEEDKDTTDEFDLWNGDEEWEEAMVKALDDYERAKSMEGARADDDTDLWSGDEEEMVKALDDYEQTNQQGQGGSNPNPDNTSTALNNTAAVTSIIPKNRTDNLEAFRELETEIVQVLLHAPHPAVPLTLGPIGHATQPNLPLTPSPIGNAHQHALHLT